MPRKFLFCLFIVLGIFIAFQRRVSAQSPQELAQCLTQKGFVMYGKVDCPNCELERTYFKESFNLIQYVECGSNRSLCQEKKITGYPTWVDAQNKQYRGAIPLPDLARISGCSNSIQDTSFVPSFSKQVILAFVAGLISFFAPCCLPLFPAYFSVISGFTFAQLYGLEFGKIKKRVFISGLFFVAGFAFVYTILGAISSFVGSVLDAYLPLMLQISGAFLLVLGLVQLGIFRFHFLEFDYAWNVQRRLRNLGFVTALITGVAAALSWIPCIGPLLSPILLLAAQSQTAKEGSLLLFIYSLGITTPFLLGGFFFPTIVTILRNHRNFFHRISQLSGIIIIGFGILLLLGKYQDFLDLFFQFIDPVIIFIKDIISRYGLNFLKFSI